jgi:hypothetical protein
MRSGLCATVLAALVGAGLMPVAGSVQAADAPAPRRLTVTVAKSGVRAPDSLAAGRYRMEVRVPGRARGLLVLVKPDAGYTRADLRRDSRRGGREATRRIWTSVRFFGGVEVGPQSSGVLWETLYAGRYWLVGFNAGRPRAELIETVRVHGSPFASSFPRVTAEAATSTPGALRLSRRAPRAGRILISNQSSHMDALFLLPLRRGADYGDFLRSLRQPRRPAPVRFRGLRQTMLLSPDAQFVLRYRLRPGNYVVMGVEGFGALFTGRTGPRVRQVIRPLTVRRGGQRARAASVVSSPQGFSTPQGVSPTWQPDWPSWATAR